MERRGTKRKHSGPPASEGAVNYVARPSDRVIAMGLKNQDALFPLTNVEQHKIRPQMAVFTYGDCDRTVTAEHPAAIVALNGVGTVAHAYEQDPEAKRAFIESHITMIGFVPNGVELNPNPAQRDQKFTVSAMGKFQGSGSSVQMRVGDRVRWRVPHKDHIPGNELKDRFAPGTVLMEPYTTNAETSMQMAENAIFHMKESIKRPEDYLSSLPKTMNGRSWKELGPAMMNLVIVAASTIAASMIRDGTLQLTNGYRDVNGAVTYGFDRPGALGAFGGAAIYDTVDPSGGVLGLQAEIVEQYKNFVSVNAVPPNPMEFAKLIEDLDISSFVLSKDQRDAQARHIERVLLTGTGVVPKSRDPDMSNVTPRVMEELKSKMRDAYDQIFVTGNSINSEYLGGTTWESEMKKAMSTGSPNSTDAFVCTAKYQTAKIAVAALVDLYFRNEALTLGVVTQGAEKGGIFEGIMGPR